MLSVMQLFNIQTQKRSEFWVKIGALLFMQARETKYMIQLEAINLLCILGCKVIRVNWVEQQFDMRIQLNHSTINDPFRR